MAVNEAFYEAVARGDFEAMEALWARHHPVACVHPGWPPLVGREAVLESWEVLLAGGAGGRVRPEEVHACCFGASAYILCIEEMASVRLVATNIFVVEDGAWRLCHHQAAPAPFPETPPPAGSGYVN